jgi:hypothetical protein
MAGGFPGGPALFNAEPTRLWMQALAGRVDLL